MSTMEIILLIIAIAFLILVLFLSTMFAVAAVALRSFRGELKNLSEEVTDLVHNANLLTVDVQGKMKHFDPLFGALSNVGRGLEARAARYQNHQYRVCEKPLPESDEVDVTDFFQLALLGVSLWLTRKKKENFS